MSYRSCFTLAFASVTGFHHTKQIPQTEPGSLTPRASSSGVVRAVEAEEGNIKGKKESKKKEILCSRKDNQSSRSLGYWNELSAKAVLSSSSSSTE